MRIFYTCEGLVKSVYTAVGMCEYSIHAKVLSKCVSVYTAVGMCEYSIHAKVLSKSHAAADLLLQERTYKYNKTFL